MSRRRWLDEDENESDAMFVIKGIAGFVFAMWYATLHCVGIFVVVMLVFSPFFFLWLLS